MPAGMTLKMDLRGDKEIAQRFERSGDAMRGAIVDVFWAVGREIQSAAQAALPSRRAQIAVRVYDGRRNRGTGKIQLIVDTTRRTRWVQQFELGTRGTGDDGAEKGASFAAALTGVRGYSRHSAGGDVFQVVGRSRRKRVGIGVAFVSSYQRMQQPMPTRPFMAPAFQSVEPTIAPRVAAAIEAALAFDGGAV